MLDSAHAHVTISDDGATLSVNDILSEGIYGRLSVKVYSLYLQSVIFLCRIECYG